MGKDVHKNNEIEKLNEKEVDTVSGGILGRDVDHADGFEKSCILTFHWEDECIKSPDGYHYWVKVSGFHQCKYCKNGLIEGA